MTSRLGHSSPANNPALGDVPKLPADKERPQVLGDCPGEAVVKKAKMSTVVKLIAFISG